TIGTATAAAGAALGSYSFNVTQLATASTLQGTANAGKALAATSDVSGLTISAAGFSTAVTEGTFTVNGKQVTLAATDTLQQVFDKINTATGGAVTGSYDPTTDKISLQSTGGEIVLGSATDSSNFLQVTKLNNNGTGTIASSASLGGVKLTGGMVGANLSTTITDGGSGAGEFKINGVSIKYSATGDAVSDVLARINNSTAGVTASYDSVNDRFVLSNKATGDTGIALEDVTGNFLSATGLSGGTLTRGKNLLYSVNNGGQLISQSNTITDASSGITGLSVTALKTGTVQVGVGTDTTKIKNAINDFLTQYNAAQSYIDTQTTSTTDATGKVSANLLTGDSLTNDIASKLRSLSYTPVSGLSGTLSKLADLGISTSGTDNSLTLKDGDALDAALANNLSSVKDLFTNTTSGVATQLNTFLEATIGDDGTLPTKTGNITKQSAAIDTQVADLEKIVQANKDRLTNEFIAMESAQAQVNQQLSFLAKIGQG
ncbi:MAG TPA: flagellar filament capping protein FliD, partial [Verrucomicrobiae bacterium]|nr:flagellar filament capping protein FliD [Verrucomicrobiae bacterium]